VKRSLNLSCGRPSSFFSKVFRAIWKKVHFMSFKKDVSLKKASNICMDHYFKDQ
jgi:hypothetical protein